MKAMKRILLILALLIGAAIAYVAYGVFINPVSPKGEVTFEKDNTSLEVSYYRPYKKERLIFGPAAEGALVPYDTYWRLGANFATVIETSTDIVFAGRQLSAGAYRIYAFPYADHWRLCLNDDAGAFGYNEPDYSRDVLCVNMPTQTLPQSMEQFTIAFIETADGGVVLQMAWDTTAVNVPIAY